MGHRHGRRGHRFAVGVAGIAAAVAGVGGMGLARDNLLYGVLRTDAGV